MSVPGNCFKHDNLKVCLMEERPGWTTILVFVLMVDAVSWVWKLCCFLESSYRSKNTQVIVCVICFLELQQAALAQIFPQLHCPIPCSINTPSSLKPILNRQISLCYNWSCPPASIESGWCGRHAASHTNQQLPGGRSMPHPPHLQTQQ